MMTIKQMAEATGTSPDTLRYYEREGLLPRVPRAANGYRQYDKMSVRRVRFVRAAQRIGFTLEEIRALSLLRSDGGARCRDVRRLAAAKREELRDKIRLMEAMSAALGDLIGVCVNDWRGLDDCPILAALERGLALPEGDAADFSRSDPGAGA